MIIGGNGFSIKEKKRKMLHLSTLGAFNNFLQTSGHKKMLQLDLADRFKVDLILGGCQIP